MNGAHYWARTLTNFGHTVRMMAPQFVKRFVKPNKNDAVDAEAICEAVQRPSMHFVPAKRRTARHSKHTLSTESVGR